MFHDYSNDMEGYVTKYTPELLNCGLTKQEAEHIFQLEPEPPKKENLNDYIEEAIAQKTMLTFCFFLHHYENILNHHVRHMMLEEGFHDFDVQQFLEYKLSCVDEILEKLQSYDLENGAAFTTYIFPSLRDGFLKQRLNEEAWSLSSLYVYKKIRLMAWQYDNTEDAISAFTESQKCELKLAEEYLKLSNGLRLRESFYITEQDEDGEETGEDITRDDYWKYEDLLWNGMRADVIREAFDQLSYREQMLLEKRLSICMECHRVGSWNDRPTFEELAVMFEGSSASGAERAYRKALNHLTELLVKAGVIHSVQLKQKSKTKRKKKIATAVYEYQADCDGDWGEIKFDFENNSHEVIRFTEKDCERAPMFAEKAVDYIFGLVNEKLTKNIMFGFEKPD